MLSFSRFPRMLTLLGTLSAVLAIARDVADANGYPQAAAALLVYTCLALVAACALMCCRFFIDEQGVGVSTLFRRRRIRWEEIAAIGYLRLNGRRVYLYGMSTRHASFDKLIVHAPFCSPGRFVVPAGRRLRAAVCRHCPFAPEGIFTPPPRVGGMKDRRIIRPLVFAALLCPAGVAALLTAAAIAVYVCMHAMQFCALLLWCALSVLCLGAGVYLCYAGVSGVLYAPSISEKGVCVGHGRWGLSMRWEDMEDVWQMRLHHSSGLYFFNCGVPGARPYVDAVGVKTPARPPMSCLSLADTHLLLLAVRAYCPKDIQKRVYRPHARA